MSKDTIHLFNNIAVKGLIANGSLGTAGQSLSTDGTNVYWAVPQANTPTTIFDGGSPTTVYTSGPVLDAGGIS